MNDRRPALAALAGLLFSAMMLLAVWTVLQTRTPPGTARLVVYCAHDAVYAQAILDEFTRQTGIPVAVQFDTEATKSLGFVQKIVQEAAAPRCDVFWNNELLGTKELQERGLLTEYQGPGWQRIPERYRDPAGAWVGFGARLRVYIVNTGKMPATEAAVAKALQGDLSRVAIAKPMFGTTLSQYSLQWSQDANALQAWQADLHRRGIQTVNGNALVKNLVAAGICDLGFTDTDDVFVALDDGSPVAMLPVRLQDRGTICIPNTVAIVRGTLQRREAERLIDFLTSAETEQALANSKSRQIPLGPVDPELIPPDVRPLMEWARDGADLTGLLPARRACLEWLKQGKG